MGPSRSTGSGSAGILKEHTEEDIGDFERLLGFDRERGDRRGSLLVNGRQVSYLFELCLPNMSEVETMERILSRVLWAPRGTPSVTERR